MNDPIAVARRLADGERPSPDMRDWLLSEQCDYWLYELSASDTYALLNKTCVQTRYSTCREMFKAFHTHDIHYAVVKGAVLSQALYHNPFVRRSGDIDLLIDRQQIDTVKAIMLENGFLQGRVTTDGIIPYSREDILFHAAATHQTAPFIKKSGHPLCPYVNVDVNYNVMWGESIHKVDMTYFLSHTERVTVCDTTVSVLSAEAAFIALCLHHYKDMNSPYLLSGGSLCLGLFCDIYYYTKHVSMNHALLRDLCEKLHVLPYIYYVIYYTQKVFEDTNTVSLCDVLYTHDADHIMHCFGLNESSRHVWTIDFVSRLFCENISHYVEQELTEQELASITANRRHM